MGAYKEVEPMGNLGKKRLFLLDMDGTIYLDQTLFPGTLPFLEAVRAGGLPHLRGCADRGSGKGPRIPEVLCLRHGELPQPAAGGGGTRDGPAGEGC